MQEKFTVFFIFMSEIFDINIDSYSRLIVLW